MISTIEGWNRAMEEWEEEGRPWGKDDKRGIREIWKGWLHFLQLEMFRSPNRF
jgi:hypothetical protein